jgi:cytochrome c556
MKRTVRQFAAALGLGALALILGVAQQAPAMAPEDGPAIDEIMKKVCSKKGACPKCETAVKDEKWEDAQKEAKIMADLGGKLGKNAAPKGDKDKWEELTKKFAKEAKAVADAAEKKDKDSATKAIGTFKKSCKNCHDTFRG